MRIAQSCLTLCDPMDCSLPGSSVHGILQNTGMGSLSLLQGIFPTQESNGVSCIAGRFFASGATREAPCPLIIFIMIFLFVYFCFGLKVNKKKTAILALISEISITLKHQSCFHSWISDHFGISKYRLAQLGSLVHVLLGKTCHLFIASAAWYLLLILIDINFMLPDYY